jgi:hypothetical protein
MSNGAELWCKGGVGWRGVAWDATRHQQAATQAVRHMAQCREASSLLPLAHSGHTVHFGARGHAKASTPCHPTSFLVLLSLVPHPLTLALVCDTHIHPQTPCTTCHWLQAMVLRRSVSARSAMVSSFVDMAARMDSMEADEKEWRKEVRTILKAITDKLAPEDKKQ